MVGLDKQSVASHKTDFTSSTETRYTGKRNFISRYEAYCKKNNSHPLREVKVAGSSVKGSLDLIVDKIKFIDWIPLLKAVSSDRSLHSIAFKSRITGCICEDITTDRQARELRKGPVLFTFCMLQKFIDGCMDCVEHSNSLRMFHLEKIPLILEFVKPLSERVAKTCCLQKLLLVGCQLGDEGCQLVTEAVKKVPSIHTLDLSANDITTKGAKTIAQLIKFQGITRYNECWKHSLRCREVNTETIPGLRRFSINDNHEVRDKGLKYIVEALYDDRWIKAIDMQNCGITDWGCSVVHKLLESNKEIVVFDLRKNDIIDMAAIASMISILSTHTRGNDITEFGWMDIANPSSEDSSSGGASCSSYNLTYTNEKVAKYVETSVGNGHPPLRAIQSSATLNNDKKRNRQVKFQRGVHKSASTLAMPSAPASTRNTSSSEASAETGKKLVNTPASGYSLRTNKQKFGNNPVKLVRNSSRQSTRVKKSSESTTAKATKNLQERAPTKKTSQEEYKTDSSVMSDDSGENARRNDRVATTFVREEMMKQTLEVGKTHGKGSVASLVDQHGSMDSSDKIELALQKLFKSIENSTNDKPESKSSISQLPQELTPSLTGEDFKSDSNKKPNRRIKETKQVCCLYFNRLEDGYDG